LLLLLPLLLLLSLLLRLFVFAVILSIAKDPDEFRATDTVRTFNPKIPHPQRATDARRPRLHPRQHHRNSLHRRNSKFDQRIFEHRAGIKSIFASKYRCNRLLLHERFTDIRATIAREKQIKGWTRAKKLELITQTNPDFKDLAAQHGLRTLQPQHYPTNKTVASRACPQIFSYFCLYRNN
jgi:putative endonuclease